MTPATATSATAISVTGVKSLMREYHSWHRSVLVNESASATAFWVLLSLGPAGLVAINVIGLIADQQVIADHLGRIASWAPGTFGDLLVAQFDAVAAPTPGTLVLDVVLVLTSLWTISTAVSVLMRGLRRGYGLSPVAFGWGRAAGALVGMVAIVLLGGLAFVLDAETRWQRAVGMLAAAVFSYLLILGIHRLAIGGTRVPGTLWRGALFSALALVVIQVTWENLTTLSPNLVRTYGAVSGLVISILGLWLAAIAILLGPFVNQLAVHRASAKPATSLNVQPTVE